MHVLWRFNVWWLWPL